MDKNLILTLAALAPKEIPVWFKPTEPPDPISPFEYKDGATPDIFLEHAPTPEQAAQDYQIFLSWRKDQIEVLPDHLKWAQTRLYQHFDDKNNYLSKCAEAKYFQWRLYFANSLCRYHEQSTLPPIPEA